MSRRDDQDDADIIKSTLTELVLILLFGFMLVSLYYGSQAKSLLQALQATRAELAAAKQKAPGNASAGANPPPPDSGSTTQQVPPVIPDNVYAKNVPACYYARDNSPDPGFLLIGEKVANGKITFHLNNKYSEKRSALVIPRDRLAALGQSPTMSMAEFLTLGDQLYGMRDLAAHGGKPCAISISVPPNTDGRLIAELSKRFAVGFYPKTG